MAHEANVHVRNGNMSGESGKVEPVHFIMEKLDEIEESLKAVRTEQETLRASGEALTTEQKQSSIQLASQINEMAMFRRYLERQDAAKSAGNKFYTSLDGTAPFKDPRRMAFAMNCLDHINVAKTGDLSQRGRFDPEGWKRQQTEGTNNLGAYTVSTPQLEMITELMEQYGVALSRCRVLRMGKKTLDIPTLATRPTVYWTGEGVAPGETAPITSSGAPTGGTITESPTLFGRPSLVAKRMMLIDTITGEVDEDSAPMLSDWLPDVVAVAFSKETDRVVLAGDVSGAGDPFNGILFDSTVQTKTLAGATFASLTYDELIDTIDTPSPFALGNAVWVLSTSINLLLRKMKDGQDRPLWQEMAMGDPNTLFGFPLVRSEVMPVIGDSGATTPFIIFGDLRFQAIGVRNDLAIDFSREADYKRGNIVMRAMQRLSTGTLIGSALSKVVTHA